MTANINERIAHVLFRGAALSAPRHVLNKLLLRPGQNVDETTMCIIIRETVADFAADMRRREAAGENVPDVSELEAMLK